MTRLRIHFHTLLLGLATVLSTLFPIEDARNIAALCCSGFCLFIVGLNLRTLRLALTKCIGIPYHHSLARLVECVIGTIAYIAAVISSAHIPALAMRLAIALTLLVLAQGFVRKFIRLSTEDAKVPNGPAASTRQTAE